jgi:YjbE family integral membrane protein
MALDALFQTIGLILQVFLLDLVLSGDNAIVIALACRALPPAQLSQAMLIGTGAAIGLRVVLTTLTSWLMLIPLLKLVGGIWLIVIAIRLLVEEEEEIEGATPLAQDDPSRLWTAVTTILAADLVMSLDNVVALAAVSQGRTLYLVLGLVMSVPLLMFGSRLLTHLLQRYPMLVPAGGALLGYVAGSIAMTDPLIAETINTQSPALTVIVPLLCAFYVVAQSRIIERRRRLISPPARPRVERRAAPAAAEPVLARADAAPLAGMVARVEQRVSAVEQSESPPVAGGFAAPDSRGSSMAAIPRFVMGIAASLVLLAVVLYGVLGGSTPPPKKTGGTSATATSGGEPRFVCPGSDVSIYYRQGASPIRLVCAEGEVTGAVDYQNMIDWEKPHVSSPLPFTLPDKIEGYAKRITLYGGSFSRVQCERQP